MINWTESMQQSFSYYEVDPATWLDKRKLEFVTNSSINWDQGNDTLGSANIETTESVGECYIRIYMDVIQNGIKYQPIPMGTFLVQTPNDDFDGKVHNRNLDAYTPLIELKENPMAIGYSVLIGENIMDRSRQLCREYMRAPIGKATNATVLTENFVANLDDTRLSFILDLLKNANFKLGLDEMGRILFIPEQDTIALQPVHTYNDDDKSILYSNISINRDLYGIPNVVEVVYNVRNDDSGVNEYLCVRAVNDDEDSPTSTVNRGREIIYREKDIKLQGSPSKEQLQLYAEKILTELSTLEYKITYTHAYCGVRTGDCVLINYGQAGLKNVKAKVISQSIKCEPGCPVTEVAAFTTKLWG